MTTQPTRLEVRANMTIEMECPTCGTLCVHSGEDDWTPVELLSASKPVTPQADAAIAAGVAQEPVALPKRGYFVYDPENGAPDFYDTDAQRDEAHCAAIKEYRNEARINSEWPMGVDNIVSGAVTHQTVEKNIGGGWDYEPAPAIAAPTKPKNELEGD